MAAETFARAYARLRVHEGGNVDDPQDPGGRTSRGVTQRVYNGFRRGLALPVRDVYRADENEIQAIYKAQYWDRSRCDELPAGVDYVVFDAAVNSGTAQANKWLQRGLGLPRIDGVIGHVTLAACETTDAVALCGRIDDRRLVFMRHLSTWRRYGRGWSARVHQVDLVGKAWAAEIGTDNQPAYLIGMERKATMADAPPVPSPALGDSATGGGAAAMAISGVQDKLQPFVEGVPYVRELVAGLIIAGGAVTVGGLAYGTYARRRREAYHDAFDTAEFRAPAPAPDVALSAAPPPEPTPAEPAAAGAAA